jgi:hypothetical protein
VNNGLLFTIYKNYCDPNSEKGNTKGIRSDGSVEVMPPAGDFD